MIGLVASPPNMPRQPRASLSSDEIHDALTDVCAEMYMLEAERLRIRTLLEGGASDSGGARTLWSKRLLERETAVESRLHALEAETASLRADLEHASRQYAASDPRPLDLAPSASGTVRSRVDEAGG